MSNGSSYTVGNINRPQQLALGDVNGGEPGRCFYLAKSGWPQASLFLFSRAAKCHPPHWFLVLH